MDCSLPGSSCMGFSRQEYWSGVPLPSPEKRLDFVLLHTFYFYFQELLIGFAGDTIGSVSLENPD